MKICIKKGLEKHDDLKGTMKVMGGMTTRSENMVVCPHLVGFCAFVEITIMDPMKGAMVDASLVLLEISLSSPVIQASTKVSFGSTPLCHP
jgi:hypothetical protein